MDILKNKQKVSYDYTSRYIPFYTYYNTVDNKYMYGLTSHLNKDVPYVVHSVKQEDTLDSLAYKYYGRPDYFWIIADFNNINDSFVELWKKYKTVRVPSLSKIEFV